MNNFQKPLWVKFIGSPGDIKTRCIENLTRNKDAKNLQCPNAGEQFYDRVKSLKLTGVNYYSGITTDTVMIASEVFCRIDQAFERIKLGIENMTMNDYHKSFDVIVEGQCLEELVLYALTYRARNIITDYSMNLIMMKFYEYRKIIQKIQDRALVIYLGDEPHITEFRLSNRVNYGKEDMADRYFISAYYSIMLADFINRNDENKFMIQTVNVGQNKLQWEFLSKILQAIENSETPMDTADLTYSPASPLYISANTDIQIEIVDEIEVEPRKKKRKTEEEK